MKMRNKVRIIATLVFCAAAVSFACQNESGNMSDTSSDDVSSDNSPGTQIFQAEGTVTGIDRRAREVTIDHGEIPGFMSAMQMTFPVGDPKILEGLNTGEKVDFEIEKRGSEVAVTKIIRQAGAETANGAAIFKANCAKCHGNKGEGTRKGISFLEGHALEHPVEDFIDQVINGEEDKMPSFKDKLSDKEIKAVVRYVREVLQKRAVKKDAGEPHQH